MRPLFRISGWPPKVWVCGRRVHHGLVGLCLLLHDRRDIRVWVRDLVKHPGAR